MRSGGCAVQQTLTAEAASILKHSLSLARRRGHAQVTPLHVASILLTSKTSLLRRACLKSQPHYQSSYPLHSRALELYFNVALNRLPTTPTPLFHAQPSLSNALIAALKRAQAHQRRGSIELQQQQSSQQPPLLTIKVELEQLVISILDDPSVSRVMREAGFSSTVVKKNIEEDSSACSVFYNSSGGVYSSPCSPSQPEINYNPSNFSQTHFLNYSNEQNPVLISPQKKFFINPTITDCSVSVKEDIKLVYDVFLRKKKRNTVIVGDSVSITENLVAELIGNFKRCEVPEELKSTHFIRFQIAPLSLRFMKREEIETNLSQLKRKVDSTLVSGEKGVIIYIGDLNWTIEESSKYSFSYNPVDHIVSEIAKLVIDSGSFKPKVWLLATASYQTYMRCQMRQPPLETQWNLQVVSVPSGGLGLTLHASSVEDSRIMFSQSPSAVLEAKPFVTKDEQDHNKLNCCSECASNYEKEAQLLKSGHQKLPAWLRPHGTESHQKEELVELKRKWSSLCNSLHQRSNTHKTNVSPRSLWNNNQRQYGRSYSYTSTYPWRPIPESNSISIADESLSKTTHSSNLVPRFRRQQSCTIEFNFGGGVQKHKMFQPNLDSIESSEDNEVKITLGLGNSVLSERRTMERVEICKVLKDNVPWQSETIPSIVEAMFDSKSLNQDNTWLLIQGNDSIGKRRLALAIAESIIGSADMLFHMNMNKRNSDFSNPPCETLAKALKNQEKLVALVEEIDLADTQFMKFLADGFEIGKFGDVVRKGQTLFILTKGDTTMNLVDNMKNKACVVQMTLKISETTTSSAIFDFDHKRKIEWEIPNMAKNQRIEDENLRNKKDMSRQSSFNTLDLNIKADDEDGESQEKPGEFSPISSDLTRENTIDQQYPNGFLELIENNFVFNRSPARNREMTEIFLSKMEECYGEVYGKQNVNSFKVEETLLEEVSFGSGCFLNSFFEKWLNDVFKTDLETVKFGGKDGMIVRLCLGGKEESVLEDGFMGSCLPKKIQICLKD